ncbi:MAG: branched-chain amino acid transport system permease protein [Actinomycetota bacterium]|jgi:branched-chain amino acid transport system permease protein|nr:branched-chain amino acid transport system permease protein [Actinomycetota bacterium]
MGKFIQILVSTVTVGSVLALVALGYNLVFSTTRIVNFAQGTMLVIAGYMAYAMTRQGLPIWLAFILTVIGSAIIGMLIELIAIRPLGRFDPATNVGWILTTFSVGLIAVDVIGIVIDAQPHALPNLAGSVFGWKASIVAGVPITLTDIIIVVSAVLLMFLIEVLQNRTMAGRAFRAVAQDRQTASLMGINTTRTVMATFALAGALAAVGAVLLAPKLFVKLENGDLLGIQAFIAAVLGGLGSTRGAVVGGFAIALTSAVVKTVSAGAGRYEPLVIFALFLAVLVVRPTGIFGTPYVEKV